MLKVNAGGGIV